MRVLSNNIHFLVSLIVFIVTISCSPVQYINNYDEESNKNFTAIHEKVASLFVQLEEEPTSISSNYDNFTTVYKEIKVHLKVLKIRTQAMEKSEIVQNQVAELSKMVNNLEQVHKIGFNNTEQVEALEQPFNAAFTAITKLQNGLKNKVATKTKLQHGRD
jgi:hypothetical protein